MIRLFALILLVIALSCEKNQDHCWRCWMTETSQREGYPINSKTEPFDICGKTHDEILKFDAEQTTETEYFYNGEKYLVTTKCHCMKKTCW